MGTQPRLPSPGHRSIPALGVLALAVLAVGCGNNDLAFQESYISPLDGQTGWSVDAPLQTLAPEMDIPPDYALPELIRVLDLDLGGFVPGTTVRTVDTLTFTPDEPFAEDRRYSWVVDVPTPVPHGPQLTFPSALEEPAIFDTRPRIDVLGGSVDSTGQTCLVLSRLITADDAGSWSIEVNGTLVDGLVGYRLDREVWSTGFDFPDDDPGPDVYCFTPSETELAGLPALQEGDRLRVFWTGQGEWLVDGLDAGEIRTTIVRLRRGDP